MLAPTKLLSVRLPEAERRRIKALAASQGLTLAEAIREAFEAWASQLQRQGAAPPGGTLAMALSVAGPETPTPQTGAHVAETGQADRRRETPPKLNARPPREEKVISMRFGGRAGLQASV